METRDGSTMRTSDEESEIPPPGELPDAETKSALIITEKDRNFLTADFSIRDLDLGDRDRVAVSRLDEESLEDYLSRDEEIFGESLESEGSRGEIIERISREYPREFFYYEKKDAIIGEIEDEYEDEDEEEDEEEEEGVYSTEPSTPEEKLEEEIEESEPVEPDEADVSLLAEIPPEILGNRDAVIELLREFRENERDLKKKNRLLQCYVVRRMRKKRETMTPEEDRLGIKPDLLFKNDVYLKKLMSYKTTVEEIEARRNEIDYELESLENETRIRLEEDAESFGEFLAREREIGIGLIFEKSGRAISEKMIDAAIRRKILRRDWLNRDRFEYIFRVHCYEDVRRRLRMADNLGQGMTIIDYEVLRVENEAYKEKLEEREKNLEKIASSIETIVQAVAHYKEKEVDYFSKKYHYDKALGLIETQVPKRRKILNQLHKRLCKIRKNCAEKKRQAGMLFAIAVVREMEKTIKIVDDLKAEIESMILEIGKIGESGKGRRVDDDDDDEMQGEEKEEEAEDDEEAGAVVTRMTGVTRAIRNQRER